MGNLLGIIFDILVLLALIGGVLWCMRRALGRTLLGILCLFLATLFSALLYNPLISWFANVSGSAASGRSSGSFVFGGLLIVFDLILEYTIHRNYPDLRIRWLKSWDHVLGGVFGVLWALFAVSLALLILNFAGQSFGGEVPLITRLTRESSVVPLFKSFFNLPLLGIRPLFPQGLPEILSSFTR